MTDVQTQAEQRPTRKPDRTDDLRRMVLLLETADVLETRARRASDPAQVAVLLRRAEQRRRDAARLREELASRGAALAAPLEQPGHAGPFAPVLPVSRRKRSSRFP